MTTSTTTTEPAPDLIHPALVPYVASLPPDDDLARLADELTEAYAALASERERGAELHRRRAALTAALADATGDARDDGLRALILVDADLATVPASIGAATTAYAAARLGYLGRLLDLADAEARRLIAATDDPITALGKARHAADVADGYFGQAPAPEKAEGLRAEAARLSAELAPAVDRYRAAKGAADLVRARVETAYGPVFRFHGGDYGTASWEDAAARAGKDAADRVRRETAA